MRALRYHGIRDLRLDDVPAPVAGPGELLIRVSVVGVCGTDAAEYVHRPHLYWPQSQPHAASGHQGPVIPGHELVGVVEAVGAGVVGFAAGRPGGVGCGRLVRRVPRLPRRPDQRLRAVLDRGAAA